MLDPNSTEALNTLAATLRRLGKNDEAMAAFRQVREISAASAKHSEAVLETNKAIGLLQQRQIAPAMEVLKQALGADPKFPQADNYMGIALSATGHLIEANRAFETALQGNLSDPDIHFNFGIALQRQSRWQDAAREFSAAVDLRPGNPQTRCLLAGALARA